LNVAVSDGLLVVDKPSGWTSHDVVARGRRLAGTRKVGHAGTLDPMATGVLLLGIGRATRLLGHLALATKEYDATVRLGQTTVTDDAEGELVATCDASSVSRDDIERAADQLRGDILQVPSSVSAIKVDGQRSYARVRAGRDVDIPARPVTVSQLTVSAVRRTGDTVDLDVHVACSTGTYVRALARDLGAVLEVGGHLTALRRTRVGSFGLEQAHTLEELEDMAIESAVLALDEVAAAVFPTHEVATALVAAIRNGRPLRTHLGASDGPVALLTPDGEFLALYEQHGPVAKPVAVFAPAASRTQDDETTSPPP
jgi:tRNA pseudouridine55 synthase